MAKAEFAIDFCFMSYHDTQKVASESAGHKFRLEHVADICLLPSKLKTCRTSAISRFILITRLVSLIFNEIRSLFTPSFDSISPKKCQKSRPMKSIKIPSRSLFLARSQPSEKFYEDLVLMEAARTRAEIKAKIEEKAKRSKSFIFTTFIPIKQSNLREPLSSVPHRSPLGRVFSLIMSFRQIWGLRKRESLSASTAWGIKTFLRLKLLFIILIYLRRSRPPRPSLKHSNSCFFECYLKRFAAHKRSS